MDVSFIIPTLDEEKYLERTLKSIRDQKTDLKFEILVVDGGSTDKTVEIAKKYATHIFHQSKRGIAAARNLGAKHAKGKLLVFIDADTYLPKNYISKVWKHMVQNDLIALTARIKYRGTNKLITGVAGRLGSEYLYLFSKLGRARLIGVNIAIWKSAFEKLKGFKQVPSEDIEFSKRVLKLGKSEYYRGTYVISSSRRFDGSLELFNMMIYYFTRDLITLLETSKVKSAKKVGKKLEKRVARYKEIR